MAASQRKWSKAACCALALALDAGIWTSDYDFFGCGVPVRITETLSAHLDTP